MDPILKYPGAKWRIAPWIISHMPPHESYAEPYAGSLAVFFSKVPARINTLNDLDGEIVNFWRVCREHPDKLAEALALTPYARAEFDAARKPTEPPPDAIERARRFCVKCWMAFGASTKSTSWRHSTGNGKNGGPDNPKLWRRLPPLIREAAERLQAAQIENRPALDIIQRFNGESVLIYADPPYVTGTRTAHRNQYHHEMTDADHVELLTALKVHEGMVPLSGYDCGLYRELLPDWEVVQLDTQAERGVARTECLWLNSAAYAAGDAQIRFKDSVRGEVNENADNKLCSEAANRPDSSKGRKGICKAISQA